MVLTRALNLGIISIHALLMAPHISPPHSHLSSQPGRWRGRERIWMKMKKKISTAKNTAHKLFDNLILLHSWKSKIGSQMLWFVRKELGVQSNWKIKILREKNVLLGNNYTIGKIILSYEYCIITQYYSHLSTCTQWRLFKSSQNFKTHLIAESGSIINDFKLECLLEQCSLVFDKVNQQDGLSQQ